MKVELYYPHKPSRDERHLLFSGRQPQVPYYKLWEGLVNGENPIEVAEKMFAKFNVGDHGDVQTHDGWLCRSLSVGDILKIDDVFYQCATIGWDLVSEPEIVEAERKEYGR